MNTSWEWAKAFPRIIESEIWQFATAIGDDNPIHHDRKAAIAAGLRGVVAPGVMVMGYLSSAIAGEIPGAIVTEISKLQFKNPLYAGVSPIVLCAKEREHGRIMQLRFEIRDDQGNGNYLLARGSCTLVLPGLPIY